MHRKAFTHAQSCRKRPWSHPCNHGQPQLATQTASVRRRSLMVGSRPGIRAARAPRHTLAEQPRDLRSSTKDIPQRSWAARPDHHQGDPAQLRAHLPGSVMQGARPLRMTRSAAHESRGWSPARGIRLAMGAGRASCPSPLAGEAPPARHHGRTMAAACGAGAAPGAVKARSAAHMSRVCCCAAGPVASA
jgi:hypothetical protein